MTEHEEIEMLRKQRAVLATEIENIKADAVAQTARIERKIEEVKEKEQRLMRGSDIEPDGIDT